MLKQGFGGFEKRFDLAQISNLKKIDENKLTHFSMGKIESTREHSEKR
jgi:hypothetical protein